MVIKSFVNPLNHYGQYFFVYCRLVLNLYHFLPLTSIYYNNIGVDTLELTTFLIVLLVKFHLMAF